MPAPSPARPSTRSRRAVPHLGEVRRLGHVPRHHPRLRGDAVQPLHRRAVREDLPDERAVSSATTASSTSTATTASAASAACRPARTTRSTSTRTPTPRRSATSAPTASTRASSRPAWSCARPTRSGSATSTTRQSGISRLITRNPVTVRAPEQNTGPNVFYLGADQRGARPARRAGRRHLPLVAPRRAPARGRRATSPATTATAPARHSTPRTRGRGAGGSSPTCGPRALGGGVLLVAALAVLLGVDLGVLGTVVAPAARRWPALAATGVLLVWDLKRPGAVLLHLPQAEPDVVAVLGSLALAVLRRRRRLLVPRRAGRSSWTCSRRRRRWTCSPGWRSPPRRWWPATPAFLFGQAEGRDLWQSPLLFWHLLVQAGMVGAGALAVALPFTDVEPDGGALVVRTLALATAAHVVVLARRVRRPARHPPRGRRGAHGHPRPLRPAVLAVARRRSASRRRARPPLLERRALGRRGRRPGSLVQVALLAYESVFVRAGQDVPLS